MARSLVLFALAGCASEGGDPPGCPLGDLDQPGELQITHFDANYEAVVTTPLARVPLLLAPQGGWIFYFGARATNIDGCRVDLTTSFRDDPTAPILTVDRRPTLLGDTGDGWGAISIGMSGTLPMCPQVAATRDLHDQPYEVTVTLDDAYGHHATQSLTIIPACPDPDSTGLCLCQCDRDYALGGGCPP